MWLRGTKWESVIEIIEWRNLWRPQRFAGETTVTSLHTRAEGQQRNATQRNAMQRNTDILFMCGLYVSGCSGQVFNVQCHRANSDIKAHCGNNAVRVKFYVDVSLGLGVMGGGAWRIV